MVVERGKEGERQPSAIDRELVHGKGRIDRRSPTIPGWRARGRSRA
jgi:hypothetical protein